MTTADVTTQAVKSAPPVLAWLIAFFAEWSLNNVIGVVTLAYILLQAGYLVWKWHRDIQHERRQHQTHCHSGDHRP